MKTAAKVFLIINICLTFYLIFPLVIGIISYKKLDEAKSTDELRVWGILSLIFVSTIAGIFMLLLKDEDLTFVDTNEINNATDTTSKLFELKRLYDEGIIDKETYDKKRAKFVEKL